LFLSISRLKKYSFRIPARFLLYKRCARLFCKAGCKLSGQEQQHMLLESCKSHSRREAVSESHGSQCGETAGLSAFFISL
jgi:hypothetical protein